MANVKCLFIRNKMFYHIEIIFFTEGINHKKNQPRCYKTNGNRRTRKKKFVHQLRFFFNIRLILFFKYKYFIFTRNLILNFSYIVLSMRIALAYNPYLDYTIIIALEHKVCWENLCRCIAVQLKIMKIVIFYKGRPSGLRERLNGPFFCRENVKLIFYA